MNKPSKSKPKVQSLSKTPGTPKKGTQTSQCEERDEPQPLKPIMKYLVTDFGGGNNRASNLNTRSVHFKAEARVIEVQSYKRHNLGLPETEKAACCQCLIF